MESPHPEIRRVGCDPVVENDNHLLVHKQVRALLLRDRLNGDNSEQ